MIRTLWQITCFVFAIFALLALWHALFPTAASADEFYSECRLTHGEGKAAVRCRSYSLPDLPASPQIIKVLPDRNGDDEALYAWCKPRVAFVDALGVEHVEYDNPRCRSQD